MKQFVNLTPHAIKLNDGREFQSSGKLARVNSTYTPFDEDGIARITFGQINGLPEPEPETIFIVSGIVAAAVKQTTNREDVVSPATGHPDCIRVEAGERKGQIISVPGFVRP